MLQLSDLGPRQPQAVWSQHLLLAAGVSVCRPKAVKSRQLVGATCLAALRFLSAAAAAAPRVSAPAC